MIIESIRGIHRSRGDRRFVRLVRFLPAEVGSEHALGDLIHTRKIGRQAAPKVLRQNGLQPAHTREVLEAYKITGDREFLTLISPSVPAINEVGPGILLSELEDPYWQMRVIAKLLPQNDHRGIELRQNYLRPFIHAVGRFGARRLSPYVEDIVRQHQTDYSLLDLATWTFGKLECQSGLELIDNILDSELARKPIDAFLGGDACRNVSELSDAGAPSLGEGPT
jgi:hypothetical protein